jgi:uracil phosphoribosyltransferase
MSDHLQSVRLHIVNHPLVQHKLTLLRDRSTSTRSFRALTAEIGALLAYELMRSAPVKETTVETPLGPARGVVLEGKKIVLVSVLRAGSGMLDGMLTVLPSARVGHIGLYRDRRLLTAVEYFCKLPAGMENRDAIIVGSVLATGGTAAAAVRRVLEAKARSVRYVCLVACPEGVQALLDEHPDVHLYTASVDESLTAEGYVYPGLGDVGDRLFGTS